MLIIGRFKMNVSAIIKGISVILILTLIGYLVVSKATIQGELTGKTAEAAALRIANQQCSADIQANNAKIDGLNKQLLDSLAASNKAVQAAQVAAGQYAASAKQILATKPTSDDCADVKMLADRFYK